MGDLEPISTGFALIGGGLLYQLAHLWLEFGVLDLVGIGASSGKLYVLRSSDLLAFYWRSEVKLIPSVFWHFFGELK